MRIAAIDVGSNSFHLVVAAVSPGGRFEILDRSKEMVRLGESLRNEVIAPDLFRRGIEALKGLRRIADRYQPEALVAVATSAVREAQNGGEFVRAARDETGIEIRVIRGQEEAHLIYLGARGELDLGGRRVALFDVGGGSTEIILADARECYFTASLKLGALRLRDEWQASDPPNSREVGQLYERIRRELEPVIARNRAMGFDFVALTSGTALALGGLASRVLAARDGSAKTLSVRGLAELERKLMALTVAERSKLPGLDPRRADTILPGAMLTRAILELSCVDQATLCESALREGIIVDHVASNRPGIQLAEEFPDQRRRSVMELARRCHYAEAHSHRVARLALSIFHQTHDLHGLPNSDGLLLEYAAILHDIGFHISAKSHHKHAHYLISTSEMRGFSSTEIRVLALCARYHRKSPPRKSDAEFAALPKDERKRVAALVAILRVADGLDRTHGGIVSAVRCAIGSKTVELRFETTEDPELELWAARRKGDFFEEVFGRKLRFAVEMQADAGPAAGSAKTAGKKAARRVAARRA